MASASAISFLSPLKRARQCFLLLPTSRPCYAKKPNYKCYSNHLQHPKIDQHAISEVSCTQTPSAIQVEDEEEDEDCELVNGSEIVIGEDQGGIKAYLLNAVKNNNGTGILLLSDIFGYADSSTRDFAYRVACNGYNVLVPDIFRGNPWKKDRPRTEFENWLSTHSSKKVSEDIDMSAKWMADEFTAAGFTNKLGIIGFCYGGGRLIETLVRDDKSQFGAGVSFYGTSMNATMAKDVKVPVLFIAGDNDPLCHIDVVKEMEKHMKDSKVLIYYGRGHGFAHRPESQEEDIDAEDAFTNMRNWFHERLE